METITWHEVLGIKDILQRDLEERWPNKRYRGPLASLSLDNGMISFRTRWIAIGKDARQYPLTESDIWMKTNFKKYKPCRFNTRVITPFLEEDDRIIFGAWIGPVFEAVRVWYTIYPSGDRLDESVVEEYNWDKYYSVYDPIMGHF